MMSGFRRVNVSPDRDQSMLTLCHRYSLLREQTLSSEHLKPSLVSNTLSSICTMPHLVCSEK